MIPINDTIVSNQLRFVLTVLLVSETFEIDYSTMTSQGSKNPSCGYCQSSLHLMADAPTLSREKLLAQLRCGFCWTSLSSSLRLPPVVSISCGHIFHNSCVEYRERQYRDTPLRWVT